MSYYLPKFDPEFGTTKGEFLSVTASSGKDSKSKAVRRTNWNFVSGQLRNLLISDELAREGIWDDIDSMLRDPTISPRVKISIVEGEAAGILGKSYAQHPGTSIYIDRLLESDIKDQIIPRATLFDFTRDFLDGGIDPVMPMLKDIGEHVEVSGLALFQADNYAGKIQADDIPVFSLMYRANKKLDVYQALGEDRQGPSHVMLSSVKSSRKITAKRKPSGQFELQIGIKAHGFVTEYRGKWKMSNEEQRRQLEREISEKLSARAEEIVALLQKKKSDVLGLGMYVRNGLPYRTWKQLDWREEYAEAKISCRIRFTIQNYGKLR